MKEHITVSISTSTLLKIVVIFLLLWFAYFIFDILVLVFISLVVASLIDPFADLFERIHLPRGLGIIILYIACVAFFVMVGAVLAPALAKEAGELSRQFGVIVSEASMRAAGLKDIINQYGLWNEVHAALSALPSTGVVAAENVVSHLTGFLNGVISFVLVFVMAFYFVVEDEDTRKNVRRLAPSVYQPYLGQLVTRIKKKLGDWLRAQLLLDAIVGFFVYVGLSILGAPYALLLGLIAGVTETVPYIGPVFAGVVGSLTVLAQTGDWIKTIFTACIFLVVQQVENHILVPKIMERTVGLNPIVSIVALLVGFQLGGVVGALLAIPIATAFSVVLTDIVQWREHREHAT